MACVNTRWHGFDIYVRESPWMSTSGPKGHYISVTHGDPLGRPMADRIKRAIETWLTSYHESMELTTFLDKVRP